jgi:hypothetical protein
VPFTPTTAPIVSAVGPISVACPVVGLISYRSGEITGVTVKGEGLMVIASKVAYRFPPALNRDSSKESKLPSGLVVPGMAGTAGIPVAPIRVAAPVSGLTV